MELRPIRGFRDALRLREIRNHPRIRGAMTGVTRPITRRQQWRWWRQYRHDSNQTAWLGWAGDRPVAFAYIRADGAVTGGVLPGFQGLGLGRQVFELLTCEAQKRRNGYLEVAKWNYRAVNLYRKLGWRTYAEASGVIRMTPPTQPRGDTCRPSSASSEPPSGTVSTTFETSSRTLTAPPTPSPMEPSPPT